MGEPVLCSSCGSILVESVDARGVTLVSGEYIQFRRTTDYVVCPSCHEVYKVRDLMAGASPPPRDPGSDAIGDEVIERLERLATGEETPPRS